MCANSEGSGETARGCAGLPELSLVAYVISTIITRAGSFQLYGGYGTNPAILNDDIIRHGR